MIQKIWQFCNCALFLFYIFFVYSNCWLFRFSDSSKLNLITLVDNLTLNSTKPNPWTPLFKSLNKREYNKYEELLILLYSLKVSNHVLIQIWANYRRVWKCLNNFYWNLNNTPFIYLFSFSLITQFPCHWHLPIFTCYWFECLKKIQDNLKTTIMMMMLLLCVCVF